MDYSNKRNIFSHSVIENLGGRESHCRFMACKITTVISRTGRAQ